MQTRSRVKASGSPQEALAEDVQSKAEDESKPSESKPSSPDEFELAKYISTASKRIHSASHSLVQARLVVLFTDRQLYGRALGCFYYIFEALERALESCKSDADVAKLWPCIQGVLRAEGFAKDCEYFLGKDWQQQVPKTLQIKAYILHLEALAKTNPKLLLAHSYTQHLAMASGGQIIKRTARNRLKLPADQGTGSFDFASSPAALKKDFVDKFNAWGATLDTETRDKVLEEHLAAFYFNNSIIKEFHIGWLLFLRGLVRLVPPLTRVSLLLAVMCFGIAMYLKLNPQVLDEIRNSSK